MSMTPQEMVISVRHAGTRSLRDHLGLEGYWHFVFCMPDIRQFEGHAHIPIRDPFDIAMSWEARYGDEMGADEMLRDFNLMLEWVPNHPKKTLWMIDDLPVHEGAGPKHWAKDKRNRGKAAKLDRSVALRRWYRTSEAAQTFYEKLFPKGFWWA